MRDRDYIHTVSQTQSERDSQDVNRHRDTTMLSDRPSPVLDTGQTMLNSLPAPLSVNNSYLYSSDVATGSAGTPRRPEAAAKQQLGPSSSLPIEVLVEVFHRMKPKQIHTAALVCSSWRTAALAATTSISIQFPEHASSELEYGVSRKAGSLRQWINRNGARVQKISMVGCTSGKIALPLSELKQLQELSVSRLQLAQWEEPASSTAGSSDAAAGVCLSDSLDDNLRRYLNALTQTSKASDGLSLLTSLTKLSLHQCPSASFNMLSALTRLRDLHLTPVKGYHQGKISTAALQQLTRLTSLSIGPSAMEHRTSGYFSKLTSLQNLDYTSDSVTHVKKLTGLPDSLTQLRAVWGGTLRLTAGLAPDLAKLTSLQHLDLSAEVPLGEGKISPCVIPDMTQLTYLALSGLCADTLGSLLSVVGGLLQLRHLELSNNEAVKVQVEQQDFKQYSALTASSQLTYLGLLSGYNMFTDGVGEYIFPPGRQLPDLKILRLGQDPDVDGEFDFTILDQKALDSIVSNCPAIEQLSIIDAVDKGVDELVTTQLSGLTKLAISGWEFTDSMVQDMLPRLSQLRDLSLYGLDQLRDLGVWEMTKLTKLTRLEMHGIAASDDLMSNGLYFECSERNPTPVWQQLNSTVRQSAKCAGVLLDRAEAALTESQAHEQDLSQRLAATHQQLSTVRQQLQQAMQAGPGAEQQLQLEQMQQQLMVASELAAGVERQAGAVKSVGQSE